MPAIVPPSGNAPLTGKAPISEDGADVTQNVFNKTWWIFFHDMAALINGLSPSTPTSTDGIISYAD